MVEHVLFAVNAVGPIILLILLGVFLRRSGFLPESFFEQGNKLVFRVLIPCSTFCSIYACPGLSSIDGGFMLYGAGIACLIFLLGLATTHLFIREPLSQSAAHQCTFRSNIPVLGTALATSLAGTDGAILLATFMIVIIPVLNVFAVVTLSVHKNTSDTKRSWGEILRNIVKNPLILACMLGLLALIVRELVPKDAMGTAVFTLKENVSAVYDVVSKLASATNPISLIVLGGLVNFSAIGGKLHDVVFGVVWKLVLAPVISVAGAALLGNSGLMSFGVPEYAVLLATFGSSIAVASAPMTAEMGGDAELARQYVMWTNVFLVVSMPVEIIILKALGLV